MNARDPFELFATLKPADEELTEADEARLVRIMEMPLTGERPVRHRRWPVLVIAGGALAATAAFALAQRDRADDPTGVVCYVVADLDADRAVIDAAADPIEACAAAWSDGRLATSGAPQLAACVSDTGVASVVPGDPSVCSKLGLAELIEDRTAEQQAVVDLQQELTKVFEAECLGQDASLDAAQALLDESGLDGWTVELAEDFPPGLECGGGGPVVESRTIVVAGVRPSR